MSENKPTIGSKLLMNLWSREKLLGELRRHALDGDIEWVALLLERTDYEILAALLTPDWWVKDAPNKETALSRLKRGLTVVKELLAKIPKERLPEVIAKDPESCSASFNISMLQIQKQPKIVLHPK